MAYLVKQSHRAPAVTSPVPVDESLPRACVIGAGSVGHRRGQAALPRRDPVRLLRAGQRHRRQLGLDNSNGQSACYDTLEINTSCPRMAFSDFPMPADYPPYARHDQVHAYFEQYVDHFGFRHTSPSTRWSRTSPASADGRWDVRITGPGWHRERHTTTPCSSPTATTGTRAGPSRPTRAPSPASRSTPTTTAPVTSSPDATSWWSGAGNSAMDIAVESSYVARTTTWSVRRTSGCCASSSSASRATRSPCRDGCRGG